MRAPEDVPRGPVLFAPGTPPAHRRRRLIFLAVFAAASLSLIWPVYALMAGPRPLVLGLPLPLAWITLWLVVMFVTLAWLYRNEPPERAGPAGPAEPAGPAGADTPGDAGAHHGGGDARPGR